MMTKVKCKSSSVGMFNKINHHPNHIQIETKTWFILYTKPQQELKVAERLEKLGLEVYCPYMEEVRQWSDRKRKIIVPLLKSYVFVRLLEKERSRVFDIPGVVRYLYWLGKPAVAYDHEITILKESLSLPYLNIKIEDFTRGKQMVIPSGPFKESVGTITKVSPKYVTVALEQLGFLVTLKY
jgi:transcriptional antiterminator RfaH